MQGCFGKDPPGLLRALALGYVPEDIDRERHLPPLEDGCRPHHHGPLFARFTHAVPECHLGRLLPKECQPAGKPVQWEGSTSLVQNLESLQHRRQRGGEQGLNRSKAEC